MNGELRDEKILLILLLSWCPPAFPVLRRKVGESVVKMFVYKSIHESNDNIHSLCGLLNRQLVVK